MNPLSIVLYKAAFSLPDPVKGPGVNDHPDVYGSGPAPITDLSWDDVPGQEVKPGGFSPSAVEGQPTQPPAAGPTPESEFVRRHGSANDPRSRVDQEKMRLIREEMAPTPPAPMPPVTPTPPVPAPMPPPPVADPSWGTTGLQGGSLQPAEGLQPSTPRQPSAPTAPYPQEKLRGYMPPPPKWIGGPTPRADGYQARSLREDWDLEDEATTARNSGNLGALFAAHGRPAMAKAFPRPISNEEATRLTGLAPKTNKTYRTASTPVGMKPSIGRRPGR